MVDTLRQLIESGEWPHDHKVPSQKELGAQFDVHPTTARAAVTVLVGDGVIRRHQGRHSRVYKPEPVHRLLISWVWEPAETAAGCLVRPRIRFVQGPNTGEAKSERHASPVQASIPVATSLGIAVGDPVIERTTRLLVKDEPILLSTSYLPASLVEDTPAARSDTESWRDVEPGQLALPGHIVTSDVLDQRSRPPMSVESASLAMVKGTSLTVLTHEVSVGSDRCVRAAAQVLARGDRVSVRFTHDSG